MFAEKKKEKLIQLNLKQENFCTKKVKKKKLQE